MASKSSLKPIEIISSLHQDQVEMFLPGRVFREYDLEPGLAFLRQWLMFSSPESITVASATVDGTALMPLYFPRRLICPET